MGMTEDEAVQAVAYYREYFVPKGMFENEVYEGIPELLEKLQADGRKLFVATSKPEPFAKQILEHFGIDNYFEKIVGATLDGSRSKKSDVLKVAISESGLTNKNEAVMIGDKSYDIDGAHENSIDAIGVLWGFGDVQELKNSKAEHIFETVAQLEKFFFEV
jgi:phosphoglycolate phosphatase